LQGATRHGRSAGNDLFGVFISASVSDKLTDFFVIPSWVFT
jgi:hypothetical protein